LNGYLDGRQGGPTVRERAERNSSPAKHSYFVSYLITFSTYGSRLHGDARGSVDPKHNQPGTPVIENRPGLERFERAAMTQPPYLLDDQRREIVLDAIIRVCAFREWQLFAVHARSNHVHVVVNADRLPEAVARDFKEYSSRALNRAGLDPPERKRWTRHSSMRFLPNPEVCERAIRYVATNQGEPMNVWVVGWALPDDY
jgi:REP element-mobilizing transposase RayT